MELRDRVAWIEENEAIFPDTVCPVCLRSFKTGKGRNSHLSTAKNCSLYRKGKFKANLLSNNDRLLSMLGPALAQTSTGRTSSRIPIFSDEEASTSRFPQRGSSPTREGPLMPVGDNPLPPVEEDPLQEVETQGWEGVIEITPLASLTQRQLRLQKATDELERWFQATLDNTPLQILDEEIGAPAEEEQGEILGGIDEEVWEALIKDILPIRLDLNDTSEMDIDDKEEEEGGSSSLFRQQM